MPFRRTLAVMPPPGFTSISLPIALAERWKSVRELIVRNGTADLPQEAQPSSTDGVSAVTALEIGVGLIEAHYKKKGR